MAKTSCVRYPEAPNGQDSELYQDLLKSIRNRPLANWIYASYYASNMGDVMEKAGISRNRQGEHNFKDVLNQIDWKTMQNEISSLSDAAMRIGAIDDNGRLIDYTDATKALQKADEFNKTYSGITATVVQHGDVYNILTAEKNARTHTYAQEVETKLKIWDVHKQAFNSIGVDIENMPQEIASTFSAYQSSLINYLQGIQRFSIDYITKKEALILFNLDPNSPHTQRLVGAFGSIENAAQAVSDINHGIGNYTKGQKTLLIRAIENAKKMQGLNLDAIAKQVKDMEEQVISQSPEEEIKKTLNELNKKYKIGINEIHRTNNKIETASDAIADAVFVLQRRVRELEREKGKNDEGKRLTTVLNQLRRELTNKRYCFGLLGFLEEAGKQIEGVDDMINNINNIYTTGTELDKSFAAAKVLQDVKALRDQYYPLVEALASDTLTFDESIGQSDIDSVKQNAKRLKGIFDGNTKRLEDLVEKTMVNIMTEVLGSATLPDGQAIINAVQMAAADSSKWDFLYSMGRASNAIVAAMGSIMRNAQDSRNEVLNKISLRIRRATDKLYKSGSNSEFIYGPDGYIVSDIDWNKFYAARTAHIKSLYKQGLRGFDLKEGIEIWEEANMEDRVVDKEARRSEKVPNQLYRKEEDFQEGWTDAQKEYYETMMQIKGEIGTLLPAYAQKQYLPPQIRRSTLDAIKKIRNLSDAYLIIKNRAQEAFGKIREDDTNYAKNGIIIDGQEYQTTASAPDNTPLREIPIFYINKLEDQRELLKDFSGALQALAGTAINYNAMHEVADVVEFIGNFTKHQLAREQDPKVDVFETASVAVFKDLYSRSKNTNTAQIVEGYILQHLYGQKRDPKQEKRWVRIIDKLRAYTSFKGLATNLPGAVNNFLVGEYQMLLEAYTGEYYKFKNYAWAHSKLFGRAGAGGDIMELLTNNIRHKGTLIREMFDPLNDNFSDRSHTRYYKSMFRQLLSHDCSFIGYSSGEYLLHYVNMYAILDNIKVLVDGKKTSLYNALEVVNKQDGNAELDFKKGTTLLDGTAITRKYIEDVRDRIRSCNQNCHGSMNEEDKGIIHQRLEGRLIMQFRQWMVEHYSRRFRKRHYDYTLKEEREGYWISYYHYLFNRDTKADWKDGVGGKLKVVGQTAGELVSFALPWFIRDYTRFMLRAQSQWKNLDEMQRYNVKRAHGEMKMFLALLMFSFVLGEPDEHKKEFWRRFWIYQTKRMLTDVEGSIPTPYMLRSASTMLVSPMAATSVFNSILYILYGIGDIGEEVKSGKHKGENKYWRNVKKYAFPYYKDAEKLENLAEDDNLFSVFKDTPYK